MKKIFCFMLTLVLLVTLVPTKVAKADTVGTNEVASNDVKLSKEDKNWKRTGYSFENYSCAYTKLDNSYLKFFKLKSSKKGVLTITYPPFATNHEYLISTSKKFTKKTTKLYYQGAKNTKYSFDPDKDEYCRLTIKKLKSGKTYYIKFRNAEYAIDKTYVSVTKWSKAKKIKIK